MRGRISHKFGSKTLKLHLTMLAMVDIEFDTGRPILDTVNDLLVRQTMKAGDAVSIIHHSLNAGGNDLSRAECGELIEKIGFNGAVEAVALLFSSAFAVDEEDEPVPTKKGKPAAKS